MPDCDFTATFNNIITISQAVVVFHVHRSTILYHINRGNVRYKTISSGNRRTYLLFKPDLQRLFKPLKLVDVSTTNATK